MWVGDTCPPWCLCASEQYALWEDGRVCGVKLRASAAVTLSEHVIIAAAFEFLRQGNSQRPVCEFCSDCS